jgi:NAD(P)-dependent dehydrogenase (short-subunit alcohol dehydrogenase family)
MQTVFISGSATGIGAGLVSRLLREGWQVFAGYRSSPPQAAPWYGDPHVIPIKCDVTSIADVEEAARQVAAKTGNTLDLLINNAGYFGSGGVVESPDMDEYRKVFEINLFGAFNVLKAFMPLVRNGKGPNGGKGRVINVASSSTYMTFPIASAYTASKQALKTATMHLRIEMQPFGVQVTTLDPGAVDTPMSGNREENSAKQWAAIPENLRSQYKENFLDTESMMQKSFTLYHPDRFADEVYRKIIACGRFKPVYVLGPGVAAMPWLHRLLPMQQVENIWARMFRIKPKSKAVLP